MSYSITICKLAPNGVLFDTVRADVLEDRIPAYIETNYPGWKINGYCLTTLKASQVA